MPESPTRRRRVTGSRGHLSSPRPDCSSPCSARPAPIPLPTPPPNPTNQQLNSAQAQKDALASRIGQLSGQIADAQQQLQLLQGRSELAEQRYALAFTRQRDAETKSRQANVTVVQARQSVVDARTKFTQYVQAQYMDGQPAGMTGVLLSAGNPTDLLEQGALQQYQSQSNLTAVDTMQAASVAKSNADASAQLLKQKANGRGRDGQAGQAGRRRRRRLPEDADDGPAEHDGLDPDAS